MQVSLYGTATSVPDRSLVAEFTHIFLDGCYSTYMPGKDSRKVGDFFLSCIFWYKQYIKTGSFIKNTTFNFLQFLKCF